MPQINIDLEDGKPPVSFVLKHDDATRFAAFMAECEALRKDAERYRFLRAVDSIPISHEAARDPVIYDAAIDAAMSARMSSASA